MKFQEIILALQKFWSEQGCILAEPYDVEKGAGTMNPSTFLRVLGPEPWNVAYVEPSRRRADIIVPEGGHNKVALEMIMERVRAHLEQA